MKNKDKLIVGASIVALLIIARQFLRKYDGTAKYWNYLYSREQRFIGLFFKYRAKAVFAKGESKEKYLMMAERNRRKAAWYRKQPLCVKEYYEK